MISLATRAFGILLLLLGLWGFAPGHTQFLGIVQFSIFHNLFHIGCGVLALISAKDSDAARMYLRCFATVFVLLGIVGVGVPVMDPNGKAVPTFVFNWLYLVIAMLGYIASFSRQWEQLRENRSVPV